MNEAFEEDVFSRGLGAEPRELESLAQGQLLTPSPRAGPGAASPPTILGATKHTIRSTRLWRKKEPSSSPPPSTRTCW